MDPNFFNLLYYKLNTMAFWEPPAFSPKSRPSPKSINILFLNKFREIGGTEIFMTEIIKNLDRNTFNPVIVPIGETSPQAYDILRSLDVKVHADLIRGTRAIPASTNLKRRLVNFVSPQGQRTPLEPAAILRLARILLMDRIHVLFYADKHAALNLAPLAALLGGLPVLIGSFHTPGLKFSKIEKCLQPLTQGMTATSFYHKRYLTDQLKIPASKIHVLYNGISLSRFSEPLESNRIREEMKLPSGTTVVGIIARMTDQKNHELLFKSARKVIAYLPDVWFLAVGDGPRKLFLEQYCKELGIADHVQFMGYRTDIGDILSVCDISALSSKDEFFPYTLLESMLKGVPVVSTNVGAISEMIEDGKSGLLVPPDNPTALADALIKLCSNRSLARSMGEESKKRVLANFTIRKMVNEFQKMILTISC